VRDSSRPRDHQKSGAWLTKRPAAACLVDVPRTTGMPLPEAADSPAGVRRGRDLSCLSTRAATRAGLGASGEGRRPPPQAARRRGNFAPAVELSDPAVPVRQSQPGQVTVEASDRSSVPYLYRDRAGPGELQRFGGACAGSSRRMTGSLAYRGRRRTRLRGARVPDGHARIARALGRQFSPVPSRPVLRAVRGRRRPGDGPPPARTRRRTGALRS